MNPFDPNGPLANWYFEGYFGIVPLEVDECVLPMIELASFAIYESSLREL